MMAITRNVRAQWSMVTPPCFGLPFAHKGSRSSGENVRACRKVPWEPGAFRCRARAPSEHKTSVANPKFAIPRANSASEFRIQSHTSNLLILVWFSNLKFLSADAILILGTSIPHTSAWEEPGKGDNIPGKNHMLAGQSPLQPSTRYLDRS